MLWDANIFGLQGARGGQPRGSERQNWGTREDVMHNRLDVCQGSKLMKVLGEGCNHGAWLAMVQ